MAWSDLPGFTSLLDLFCPPRCAFCGVDIPGAAGGVMACTSCREAITRYDERCQACGAPRPASTCGCGGRRREWDGIAILGGDGDEMREHVLRAKRPGGEHVAVALAGLLVARHRPSFDAWQVDAVTAVPMHWRRRWARGTNPAAQLAAGVARGLRLPHRRLLRRVRATPMQNQLAFDERRGNVRGAFAASRRTAGTRVLLVDDVTTTGATLAECRRALVEAGAAAVYAAVVARADRASSDVT